VDDFEAFAMSSDRPKRVNFYKVMLGQIARSYNVEPLDGFEAGLRSAAQ
jgi:hypothetical protein